jgi:hypothetical protein
MGIVMETLRGTSPPEIGFQVKGMKSGNTRQSLEPPTPAKTEAKIANERHTLAFHSLKPKRTYIVDHWHIHVFRLVRPQHINYSTTCY